MKFITFSKEVVHLTPSSPSFSENTEKQIAVRSYVTIRKWCCYYLHTSMRVSVMNRFLPMTTKSIHSFLGPYDYKVWPSDAIQQQQQHSHTLNEQFCKSRTRPAIFMLIDANMSARMEGIHWPLMPMTFKRYLVRKRRSVKVTTEPRDEPLFTLLRLCSRIR